MPPDTQAGVRRRQPWDAAHIDARREMQDELLDLFNYAELLGDEVMKARVQLVPGHRRLTLSSSFVLIPPRPYRRARPCLTSPTSELR